MNFKEEELAQLNNDYLKFEEYSYVESLFYYFIVGDSFDSNITLFFGQSARS